MRSLILPRAVPPVSMSWCATGHATAAVETRSSAYRVEHSNHGLACQRQPGRFSACQGREEAKGAMSTRRSLGAEVSGSRQCHVDCGAAKPPTE